LYIKGRAASVVLRGINPEQKSITIPTNLLVENVNQDDFPPILIGKAMPSFLNVGKGDIITLKWRDSRGTFDAFDFRIRDVFTTTNPRVDMNNIWLSLGQLQKMCEASNQVSFLIFSEKTTYEQLTKTLPVGWISYSQNELTKFVQALVKSKQKGALVMFALLLFLSGIGILNAQILSVFKRQREIGVLLALGMNKNQVVRLFTLEGIITTLTGFVGMIIFGSPLLYLAAIKGIPIDHAEGMGMPLPEFLLPHYSMMEVATTLFFIFCLMTFVSWWPTRRISCMEPARAIRGRGL
jgi:ABC-type lipoprotein release transport system permease subunit